MWVRPGPPLAPALGVPGNRPGTLPGPGEARPDHAGCPVLEADFTTFDFSPLRLEELLLVGAFVHVPHGELPALLSRCTAALKPGGLVPFEYSETRSTPTSRLSPSGPCRPRRRLPSH